MADATPIYTYIIETIDYEYYCGKTYNINDRMKQHKNENKPHWFSFGNRKNFKLLFIFNCDLEKQIKRCGVKQISNIIKGLHLG